MNNLDAFFNPTNIAIVGASANPEKAGYTILSNLVSIGYPKKVFPIHASEKEILGFPCYPKLAAVPDRIEMVVLVMPSKFIYEVMEDLEQRMREKGDVRVIVCAAADYAETKKEEGIRRQACLMETARRCGIRVMGPNCIGVIDNVNRVDTTFVETLLPKESRGKRGGISFISQSGSVAASLLMIGASQPAPISLNKFVSIGNMADVDFIDLLNYFEEDPDTKVIGIYMEGYADGARLIKNMARIARKKPIVVFKVGRSEIGAEAANSHTGSLAGADQVYSAAFRQYGVIQVDTIEELMDVMQAFNSCVLPQDERTFVLTQAGGPGIYCTDCIEAGGRLKMPVVSQDTKEALRSCLLSMASVCSPEGYADITASATVAHHVDSLRIVLEDSSVSNVIFITVLPTFLPREELANGLVQLLKGEGWMQKKPVYVCVMAGNYALPACRILEANGIRTYDTPRSCVRTAERLTEYASFLRRKGDSPIE
ncbi:MAG TPA: CoA-binding protein [Anaerovoracaceae bacterium]|nr:CoA-binding protein [Anaerovoracaceae bacterium]